MAASTSFVHRVLKASALIVAAFMPALALADIENAGLLDNALTRYSTVASTWSATITTHATWLFWTLALISMVWTFGMLALRRADIGEFFAEFIRFTLFTGFFWWLLVNGPRFATSIMSSLRQIASQANGSTTELTPSGIVDIGFDIFARVLEKSTIWSPFASGVGVLISLITLIVLALIAVNMLVLLISGWVLAYAGIFFLGFGGSRWTSDMAIAYFRTVLGIAVQLFAMVLLVGIGKSFIDAFYTRLSSGLLLNELVVVMIASLVLLVLVNKVPGLLAGISTGGGTGSLGTGSGMGSVAAAAAVGAAAFATAGGAAAAGMANIGGGAQALMAAFKKASAAESAGSGASDLMAATTGAGQSGTAEGNGSDALAAAMGSGSEVNAGRNETGSSASSAPPSSSTSVQRDGADSGSATGASDTQSTPSQNSGTSANNNDMRPAAGSIGKAGRIAAGTAAALAKGSWEVAKGKASQIMDSAANRMADTTGGKIAAAIVASHDAMLEAKRPPLEENENSLSAGKDQSADAGAEVTAFRNSK